MKDFVTFEIAKKLKEKGFPQKCCGKYEMQDACYIDDGRFYKDGCIIEVKEAYTAPTIAQVLKWLRKKNIHIVIDLTVYGFISNTISFKWDKSYCELDIEHYDHEGYRTYEKAVLAEIDYVLDNLF